MAGIAGDDRESPRLSRVAIVIAVSLAHASLFLLALRGIEAERPSVVIPSPISVRWIETPMAGEPPTPLSRAAEPSSPAVTPVETPRHKSRSLLPARPRPAATLPVASAPATMPEPVLASSVEAPASGSLRNDGMPPVTPPRADAAYLSNPAPDYPAEARRLTEEGRVLLRVLVASDGHAADVSVDQGCGFPLLDAAATAAVRRWRFTPGRRGETAVDAWVLIPILFKLRTR